MVIFGRMNNRNNQMNKMLKNNYKNLHYHKCWLDVSINLVITTIIQKSSNDTKIFLYIKIKGYFK
jgi:hypothetical protein